MVGCDDTLGEKWAGTTLQSLHPSAMYPPIKVLLILSVFALR
jgi:hypothetical protein